MRSGGRRATPTAREPESAQLAYTAAIKRLARQPQSRAALRQRLLRLGYVDAALVEKAGSWFSCNGQRLGQGREQTVGFLKANPKLGEELIAQLKGKAAEKVLQPA